MPYFFRNSLIGLLLVFISATGCKCQRDADAVVTMSNGQLCFSYPQDKEIRKRPYLFYDLVVSKVNSQDGEEWYIETISLDRKGLREPNSPETCIKYGIINPGIKVRKTAEPLQVDTAYRVSIDVSTASASTPGYVYERRYRSDFCLSRNAKGETILVGADWDDKTGAMICLKPGESPKRSFWQKLFGK